VRPSQNPFSRNSCRSPVAEESSFSVTEEKSALEEAEKAYEEQIWRDLPRNYAVNLAHGMLGQTGFRLIHAPTFLPAFIFLLSGSELAVGLALAAQHFGAASSSIFGATLIEHRKKVIPIGFVIEIGRAHV